MNLFYITSMRSRDEEAFKDLTGYLTQHGRVLDSSSDKKSKKKESILPFEEDVQSRQRVFVIYGMVVLCLSVFLSLFFLHGDIPITGQRITLGQPGYDAAAVHAPSLSGMTLSLVSKFLSTSRFAPWYDWLPALCIIFASS